ncbi:Surface antigen variable number repeat [Candidatus Electrothrix communis]|uniref:Surface antigen variable number repeat n=1 Tax=Candidatus Electrothrix communis TaxID=1859133 RepID=A0A444IZE5_9BACT|nr:Surface antigen variable number repeat [Candidatus Electrothrix communis]
MLDRYLPYSSGDVYSLSALNQLQTDLYATGYFSQVFVDPRYPGSNSKEQAIPIEIELKPGKKNRYSFGVGYGTDTGARGNIGWKNRILNRHGHKPEFNIQLAENGSRSNAGYEIPVFDLRYDSVNFNTLFLMKPGKIPGLNSFRLVDPSIITLPSTSSESAWSTCMKITRSAPPAVRQTFSSQEVTQP